MKVSNTNARGHAALSVRPWKDGRKYKYSGHHRWTFRYNLDDIPVTESEEHINFLRALYLYYKDRERVDFLDRNGGSFRKTETRKPPNCYRCPSNYWMTGYYKVVPKEGDWPVYDAFELVKVGDYEQVD